MSWNSLLVTEFLGSSSSSTKSAFSAQYVEPFSSSVLTINDLRRALVHRVLQTWGIRLHIAMLNIQIVDWQGHTHTHTFNGEDILYQIMGAFHPFWFRGGDRTGYPFRPFRLLVRICYP